MSSPTRLLVLCFALCTLAPWAAGPTAAQEMPRFTTEVALDVASPQVAAVTEDGARAVVVRTTPDGSRFAEHLEDGGASPATEQAGG